MAKSYFSFEFNAALGQVATSQANFVVTPDDRTVITAANEFVLVWNLRTQECQTSLRAASAVTSLDLSGVYLAAGLQSGEVKVWSNFEELKHDFDGHEAAISSLKFAPDGLTLASGSADTSIILWDLVADSALVKLQGHRDAVTAFLFSGESLVSGSKDGMIKFWDLRSHYCTETLFQGKAVWTLAQQGSQVYSAGGDPVIRRWDEVEGRYAEGMSLSRQFSKKRTRNLALHPTQPLLLCQISAPVIELYRLRGEAELQKMLKRRRKRSREKQKDSNSLSLMETDKYHYLASIKPHDKVTFAMFCLKTYKSKSYQLCTRVAVLLACNELQVWSVHYNHLSKTKTESAVELLSGVYLPGHRSAARTLALAHDNSVLVSASGESVKFWDLRSKSCVGTMSCEYATCSLLLEDSHTVVIGCKSGLLQVFDLNSMTKLYELQAHTDSVWGLTKHPRHPVVASGGADHAVKFYKFKQGHLQLAEVMSLADDVIGLSYCSAGKFLCAALLDNTLKVFFADSHKLILSLYGHKLPITAFDISSDSSVVATGGADKNLKFWGLDFGDCHKTLIAHEQSIMAVKYVPETHFLFTASKDRSIKYWDGDKYQCILTLPGHQAEVWALAVSSQGDFVVSAANDMSIRLWTQTSEQVFMIEQREKELEQNVRPEDLGIVKSSAEAAHVLRTSEDSLKATEVLMDAIEAIRSGRVEDSPRHILGILKELKATSLESALQILPYAYCSDLLDSILQSISSQEDLELLTYVALFIIKLHEPTIISSGLSSFSWAPKLQALEQSLRSSLSHLRDVVGFNIAACQFVLRS
jgi:U3 small nucleolar RNA-associated protein 12